MYRDDAKALVRKTDALMGELNRMGRLRGEHLKEKSELASRAQGERNLYKAARSDRAVLDKALTVSNETVTDLRAKLKVMQHQFDQMKEESVLKESALAREKNERDRMTREKEELEVAARKRAVEESNMRERVADAERRLQEKLLWAGLRY